MIFVVIAPVMLWSAEPRLTDLERSTVSIRRYVASDIAMTKRYGTNILSVEGTAWFYRTSKNLVTVMHNVEAMFITSNSWTEVELFQSDLMGRSHTVQKTKARLVFSHKIADDGVVILELQDTFPEAHLLVVSEKDPKREEPVQTVGYVDGRLRFGKGNLTHYEWGLANGHLTPELFGFNIENTNSAFATDLGCSGAAIINTRGQVVALLKSIIVVTIGVGNERIRAAPIGGVTCKGLPVTALLKQ